MLKIMSTQVLQLLPLMRTLRFEINGSCDEMMSLVPTMFVPIVTLEFIRTPLSCLSHLKYLLLAMPQLTGLQLKAPRDPLA